MPPVKDPGVRDLLNRHRSRKEAEAAEAALRRLLASIENGEADGGMLDSHGEALRRHGRMIHGEGGSALLRLVFDRLCRDVPAEMASRRFDLLSLAWGSLLSKGGTP